MSDAKKCEGSKGSGHTSCQNCGACRKRALETKTKEKGRKKIIDAVRRWLQSLEFKTR